MLDLDSVIRVTNPSGVVIAVITIEMWDNFRELRYDGNTLEGFKVDLCNSNGVPINECCIGDGLRTKEMGE